MFLKCEGLRLKSMCQSPLKKFKYSSRLKIKILAQICWFFHNILCLQYIVTFQLELLGRSLRFIIVVTIYPDLIFS